MRTGFQLSDRWDGLRKHYAASKEEPHPGSARTGATSLTLCDREGYRNALLLPYLNKEALLGNTSVLLCLMHNRTAFPPEEWAMLDLQLISFGRDGGLLERRFNESSVSISTGIHCGYGDCRPAFDEFGVDMFHTPGLVIGFPNAEILFESQQKLYSFLRHIITDLLKDHKNEKTGDMQWFISAQNLFPEKGNRFPRGIIGVGQAADRHICSPPSSICTSTDSLRVSASRRAQHA